MSKKTEFVDYVQKLMDEVEIPMSDNVKTYWAALCGTNDEEKPMFTDNGKLVMKYLQELPEGTPMLKAKDIAEGMFISSRVVSGSMRKLVTDGYVEKIGQDPVMYSLTEKGKTVQIKD